MLTATDSQWMAQALNLAARGLNTTSPNPRVGCLIVQGDKPVSLGWHERAGEPHAEVHALQRAGEQARGATVYVTLEPCSHFGRTPPCADALIAAGVARVVCASQDPNPKVAGQGIARLRAAGIEVECGLMESEAVALNIGFYSRMERGLPWVRSKIAASLDGRTALNNGTSKWITGAAARQDVQHWRARSCAVLTGVGTILSDDPQLNVRGFATPRQPLRVVLDSQLRLPTSAKLLQGGGVLVYTVSRDAERIAALQQAGAEVVTLREQAGQVNLAEALRDLAVRGMNEVLVEAGRTLNGALFRAGLVDELLLYLAPQLLGDVARGMVAVGELTALDERIELAWQDVRHVGTDLRLTARVKR